MAQSDHPSVGSLEADQVQLYASYGKACLNCVRSKTRCASSATGGKCDRFNKSLRCHRLNKDCQPAPAVRRRRVSKRPTSSPQRKTAALEEKLDGIVRMLQLSQAPIPGISQPQGQIQNERFDSSAVADRTLTSNEASDTEEISHNYGDAHDNIGSGDSFTVNYLSSIPGESLGGVPCRNGQTICSKCGHQGLIHGAVNGPPTPATSGEGNSAVPDKLGSSTDYPLESEAELSDCLEIYRTKMAPYFPIVCIGPEVTVEELSKKRPFLFLVIRAICSKNLRRHTALVLQVRTALAKELLLEGAKNLDLLLGILVFAGWCHYYICNKPITSTAIQLGMSLAFDLGLTRPLPGEALSCVLHYIAPGFSKPINGITVVRTMEERRAAIGLFLISSVAANYFQRIELMHWTPYLDQCLHLLEEKKDFPTDSLLVYLVRVQLICNKAAASTWNDVFGGLGMQVPAHLYVKTLKSQLDDLDRSIPLELKSNVNLRLHILSTTLCIHEHSLSATSKSTSSDPAAQLQRIESLWVCLATVKSCFNTFFCLDAFPLSCYPHISMALVSQMSHCLVALYRLSLFEAPEISWDRERVRQELDLGDVVRLVVDRLEQVPQAAGLEIGSERVDDGGDEQRSRGPWEHMKKRILGIGNCWAVNVAAMATVDTEGRSGREGEENVGVNRFGVSEQQQIEGLEFGAMNMDPLDDFWMRDFLRGGYEYNL